MKISKFLINAYYEHIASSTASKILSKKNAEHNAELRSIYSSMKALGTMPNFTEIENFLKNKSNSINENADVVGVIVETREHPQLEKIIDNFIRQTKLKVQLFHGTKNLEYILKSGLKKHIENGQLQLYPIQTSQLNAAKYNALFLTKDFWNAMIGRNKIFIFQTDSWLCENSPYSLNDFLNFDYIGSRWQRKRPIGLIIDGGSGGLSIRDWHKSVKCLEIYSPLSWKGGEDGYFAFHIELLGGKVAKKIECEKFSTQEIFRTPSYGAHQISLLTKREQEKFLEYCPNASFLIE